MYYNNATYALYIIDIQKIYDILYNMFILQPSIC